MPEVNHAIEMTIGHGAFNLLGRHAIGCELRDNRYTHAIVLPNSSKSALIPWFANIPKRTGWKGKIRYGLLNDLRPNKRVFQYMVERYVALAHPKATMLADGSLAHCPRPKLVIDAIAQQAARQRLGLVSSRPVIGLCPGRIWPSETLV